MARWHDEDDEWCRAGCHKCNLHRCIGKTVYGWRCAFAAKRDRLCTAHLKQLDRLDREHKKLSLVDAIIRAARIECSRHDEEARDGEARCELCEAVAAYDRSLPFGR